MTIVVRCTSNVREFQGEAMVDFDFGEADDFSTIDELLEDSGVDPSDCQLLTYTLSTDGALKNDATHIAVIVFEQDQFAGRMLLADKVIDGTFLILLAQGDKLKGFHCENCARHYVSWFVQSQGFWKETYHAAGIEQKIPRATVH